MTGEAAQHLIQAAALLAEQVIRDLNVNLHVPEPDIETLMTPSDVIALPVGAEFRSNTGTMFQRVLAGVLRLKDGKVYGSQAVTFPASVTFRPEPEAVLTTIQDLINQSCATVIRSASGAVYERGYGTKWYATGSPGPVHSGEIDLPARVLS